MANQYNRRTRRFGRLNDYIVTIGNLAHTPGAEVIRPA